MNRPGQIEKENSLSHVWDFPIAIPVTLLTFGCILLWKRAKSSAISLMTVGFSAVFASELVNYATSIWPILATYRLLESISSNASLGGQWIAAIGFLWYA